MDFFAFFGDFGRLLLNWESASALEVVSLGLWEKEAAAATGDG